MSMSKNKPSNAKGRQSKKPNNKFTIGAGVVALIIAGFFFLNGLPGQKSETVLAQDDLTISKTEVSETAKFYPYKTGKTYMEVIAVKAKDGSIRTALNTCQVCYNSGRGYYMQEGNELVCQNCGNRFKIEQVEVIKGGCNPVPIMKDNKQEDADNIIVSKDFLMENAEYFKRWKK